MRRMAAQVLRTGGIMPEHGLEAEIMDIVGDDIANDNQLWRFCAEIERTVDTLLEEGLIEERGVPGRMTAPSWP